MSTPLIERPEKDLEAAIGEVEGRKQVIATETLRRRYLAKGWSDWIARLRIFGLRKAASGQALRAEHHVLLHHNLGREAGLWNR